MVLKEGSSMSVRVIASFDGKVFVPKEPVSFTPGTDYALTVEQPSNAEQPYILTQIMELATDMGVTDLAEHHDDYALGRRKLPE
jgi:hypothetical protein